MKMEILCRNLSLGHTQTQSQQMCGSNDLMTTSKSKKSEPSNLRLSEGPSMALIMGAAVQEMSSKDFAVPGKAGKALTLTDCQCLIQDSSKGLIND